LPTGKEDGRKESMKGGEGKSQNKNRSKEAK
jgi:hypothetical protein